MDGYRDCKGHLVCRAETGTGLVEIHYRDRTVRMSVPVGGRFTVTLSDTVTTITRTSQDAFKVESSARTA